MQLNLFFDLVDKKYKQQKKPTPFNPLFILNEFLCNSPIVLINIV
jgi:hypothetical protein